VAVLAAGVAVAAGAAVWIAGRQQQRIASSFEQRLARMSTLPPSTELARRGAPAPVERYLRWALPEGAELATVRLQQEGSLRTDVHSGRWMRFTATHIATASIPGFFWNARVTVAPLIHVRIFDTFVDGTGSGRVSLLSAIPMSKDEGTSEMNSGSLHRYLAEAPWYPTALRPSDGLTWTAIDATRALATLRDHEISVSLEFRFDESGAITAIYTPGRWGSFANGYHQLPWEGHFRDYVRHQGIAIPTNADVGWYVDGPWQPVWKGHVEGFEVRATR
jgi:hypothetical protein